MKNTKIYQSVAEFKKDEFNNQKENNIFTGFRPSAPRGTDKSIWFTLWHMLQLEKLKSLSTNVWWNVYCIIADCQWYSDFSNKNHAANIKWFRDIYIKSLFDTIDFDNTNIMPFLESDVRRNVDSLKWLIEYHIEIDDIIKSKHFESKYIYEKSIWRSSTIWHLINDVVWQSSQLIWWQTAIVPAWIEQQFATEIWNKVVNSLNNEFDLWLNNIVGISDNDSLLWIDWEVMSTNRWNTLNTFQSEDEIKKILNKMPEYILIQYYNQFFGAWWQLGKLYNRNELIEYIVDKLKTKYSSWNIKDKLHTGAVIYSDSITQIENKIHKSIFW